MVQAKHIKVNIIFVFASIAYYAGLICHFSALLPDRVIFVFYALSLVCGLLVILCGLNSCSDNVKRYLFFWVVICLYMIVVGLVNSNVYKKDFSVNIFLSQDLRFITFVGCGITLADKKYLNYYITIMKSLITISLIMGAVALLNYSFDYSRVTIGARLGIWSLPYYLWWASASVFAFAYPYARMVEIKKTYKIIEYSSFFIYIILGLLFIKRSALVNSIIIILLTEIVYVKYSQFKSPRRKIINRFAIMIVVISISIMILYTIPYSRALIDAMLNRMQGNFFEYDRSIEASNYIKRVGLSKIILGQGIGHYFRNIELVNALHTGFYNLIYKGGFLLLSIYVYFVLYVIKILRQKNKYEPFLCMSIVVSISYIISMLYEASWSYTIYMVQYVTPILSILLFQIDKSSKFISNPVC